MDEIVDGVWHWTTMHEGIGMPVSSYYVEPIATAFDPREPDEGLDWFEGRPLDRVVLSNRHHYRHADRFAERFGVPVLAVEEGMHEVGEKPGVQSYAFGDSPAPECTVHPIQPGWPDEGAIHIRVGPGLLLIADAAMRYGEELHFVPDQYIGDDVEGEKRRLKEGLAKLLDLDFDVLLVGHGTPIASGGKDALASFVQAE